MKSQRGNGSAVVSRPPASGAPGPPHRSVSARWLAALALAQLGLWLGLYAPLKILLPLLADPLSQAAGPGAAGLNAAGLGAAGLGAAGLNAAGSGKEALLAAATLVGSLVALVANPLAGALSDRTRSPWGQRHPWILGGTLLAAAAIAALPRAASPLALLLGWAIVKIGLNAAMAGLNGTAADRVPAAQQGGLWGWIGMAQPLGLVLGVLVSSALVPDLSLAAAALALLLLATAIPFLATRPGQGWQRGSPFVGTPAPSKRAGRQRRGGRIGHSAQTVAGSGRRCLQVLEAFRHRPFGALWWSRFWLYLGWSASTVYLLYFLEDRLGLPRPQALQAQVWLLLLYTAATALSAAWAGQASDRLGRRLLFVLAGSGAMGLACGLMGISQSLPLALAGSTLLGLGYGIYVATHQALVVAHLPDPQQHGRDLGVFNGAHTASMVLAPALAWLLVSRCGGYGSLFGVSGGLILLSNLPLWRLRSGGDSEGPG